MTSSPVSHHQTRVWGFLANQNQRNVAHMMMRSNFLSCQNWKNGKNWLLSKLPLTRNMYFLASRNARCFSAFHTDVLIFVACSYFDSVRDYLLSGIQGVFADSRSLDGISHYRSVNYG